MFKREQVGFVLMAIGLMSMSLGCRSDWRAEVEAEEAEASDMSGYYLEIVSNDVDSLMALYQDLYGLSFGPPDPDLGQARVATRADGTLVGIREPLAAHEEPIVRTYLVVEDIQQAVKKAEDSGATVAYPPTRQGDRGTFAIVFQGDVQHGLWQR
jgi:predicted enzyme related to lactoylglutathione lyase